LISQFVKFGKHLLAGTLLSYFERIMDQGERDR